MKKNNIIGFVLIGLIMIGFSWYSSNEAAKQQAVQREKQKQALIQKAEQAAADTLNQRAEKQQEVVIEKELEPDIVEIYKDSTLIAAKSKADTTVVISNDLIELTLSSRGAQPASVKIKDYKAYGGDDLYLFNGLANNSYEHHFYAGEDINTGDFTFDLEEVTESSASFRLYFSNGGYVEQKYSLNEDSYLVDNDITFVNMKDLLDKEEPELMTDWVVVIPRLEKGYDTEKQYSKLNYKYKDREDPIEIAVGKNQQRGNIYGLSWFAVQQQFFSAIMSTKGGYDDASFDVRYYKENSPNLMYSHTKLYKSLEVSENSGEDVIVVNNDVYYGPNDYNILKSLDRGYESIVPLGGWMVSWFNKWVIIPVFDFLGAFISNYGIIILLLTLMIKLIISPLTIRSYKSTAKMQALRPEMQKINEKYPDQKDAMKKQQATMELYQKAGVSPLGGCLPMLLQMPILFAMFRFFPSSVELRQQGFLWAEDLSSYDSILDFGFNIPLLGDHLSLFALLMAASMFFYSKFNSAQADNSMPGMKFMSLWLMPIMMFVICNNLSSALSYYYLLSNLVTMAITWYIRKFIVTEEKVRAEMLAASKRPRKKSKWQMRLEEAQKMQEQMRKEQQKKNRR